MLANSGASAFACDDENPGALGLAAHAKQLKVLASIDMRTVGFTSFDELLAGEPMRRYSTADPPLIVYTSGTTGRPKGVHRPDTPPPTSINLFGYRDGDRHLCTGPLYHAAPLAF